MLQSGESPSTAISILLGALEPQFRLIARRYGINAFDAEDLLQETFLRFLRTQRSIADPFSWLPFVFRRECLRFLRKRKQSRELAVNPEGFGTLLASAVDDSQAERLDLIEAFKALRARDQLLLWWRYGLGLSEVEVASALGCKRGSAKKASSRALGAIRRTMSRAL